MKSVKALFQVIIAIIVCTVLDRVAVASWERVPVKTLASLHAVDFLDSERGWIAGSRGTLLTSVDGGKSWKPEKPFTQDNLVDIHFVDSQNGWLLCERDVYSTGKNAVSYLRRTSDGGKTWVNVELDSGRDRLVRLAFTKDGFGYALGEGGGVWQMLDDRITWKRSQLPVRFLMRGGWFMDSYNGVLVGGSGTRLFTTDAGTEWALSSGDKPVESKLNGVFFLDSKRGWAVGAGGTILSTLNGGKMWRVQTSGVIEDLFSVCFSSGGIGVAVGDRGRILESSASGSEWVQVNSGVTARLEDVTAAADAMIAVGFGGSVLRRN